MPFQCCLIKTSQAAPLDCFDARGPIVHKNQSLDRWGRGAGRGEEEEGGGEGGESWQRSVCVCKGEEGGWGGGGVFRGGRGIREGRETTEVQGLRETSTCRTPAHSLFRQNAKMMLFLSECVLSPPFTL